MSQSSSSPPPQLKSRIGAILRSTSGNFLEQFDFFLFGFYAPYIAKAFFPSQDETAALLNTFGVFWLGALMRPVGAIVLGAYIDRIGRRKGLIVTLAIMAIGTVTIAVCPTYASIGVAAPIIVLIGRLLQGFSAGVELGGGLGLSRRDRDTGQQGFLYLVPILQPAGRDLRRRDHRICPQSRLDGRYRRSSAGLNSPNGEFPSSSAASSFPSSSSCAERWKKRRNSWR